MKNVQDEIAYTEQKAQFAKIKLPCDACMWLKIRMTKALFDSMTKSEQRSILRAQKHKYRIMPGQKYVHETGFYRGKAYESNYLEAIHQINMKYGFYQTMEKKTNFA